MKLQRSVYWLVACCLSIIALAGGVGVARAQPEPVPPPLPPAIDPLSPLNPAVTINSTDEGGQPGVTDNFGRVCENWWVHCQ
jgi:hypothetical protein